MRVERGAPYLGFYQSYDCNVYRALVFGFDRYLFQRGIQRGIELATLGIADHKLLVALPAGPFYQADESRRLQELLPFFARTKVNERNRSRPGSRRSDCRPPKGRCNAPKCKWELFVAIRGL